MPDPVDRLGLSEDLIWEKLEKRPKEGLWVAVRRKPPRLSFETELPHGSK